MRDENIKLEPFLAQFVEPLLEKRKGETRMTEVQAESVDEN